MDHWTQGWGRAAGNLKGTGLLSREQGRQGRAAEALKLKSAEVKTRQLEATARQCVALNRTGIFEMKFRGLLRWAGAQGSKVQLKEGWYRLQRALSPGIHVQAQLNSPRRCVKWHFVAITG